jgi:signal transduction histidine kinase
MANEEDFGNAVSCARLNFGNPDFVFNNTRDYLQDVSAPRPEDYLSELRGYFAQAAGANPAFEADLAHIDRVSMLGELVASISHELAQPITVTTAHAKASLRWLQRDPPDLTEIRKGTERIIEAGTLASEIISRLRSLYKKTPPHRESVDAGEVIGEMVLLLRGEATRAGAWRITRNGLTMRPLLQPQLSISSKLIARANDSSRVVSEFVRTLKRKLDSPRRIQLDLPLPMKAS